MQSEYEAHERFISWLDSSITRAGRGEHLDELDTEPRGTFWLGRLAPEYSVLAGSFGARSERLDPCAMGMRVRPKTGTDWKFRVKVGFRAWTKIAPNQYAKSPLVEVTVPVELSPSDQDRVFGTEEINAALLTLGLSQYQAEIRVEVDSWRDIPELVITLVNVSEEPSGRGSPDLHLYEVVMEMQGLCTTPFLLEALPDSFRYDRRVAALGVNSGLVDDHGVFRTVDTVVVNRARPTFWTGSGPEPDLSFERLGIDPIPVLNELVDAAMDWGRDAWDLSQVEFRSGHQWTEQMWREAERAADEWRAELERLKRGVERLASDRDLLTAFKLMNGAIRHSARGRYEKWRTFQLGFLLSAIGSSGESGDSSVVDTIWFATGGGKTETYLGLIVMTVLLDRLREKGEGISVWTRFPLRMLSLQQTQRFADALAGAELMRREAGIGGAPISLGYFVGNAATPNSIPLEPSSGEPDPHDRQMPARYQVLLRCPFCHGDEIEMHFNRARWTLEHRCPNPTCPWTEDSLPFFVVDQEIYRFLPSVVIGTLDKAALVGMQAAMRGFYGSPLGVCSRDGHGFTYSPRSSTPTGCLVPGCRGSQVNPVGMSSESWAPTLRLQDELHLLRDTLGAVDSHYEAVLDHLQTELGGPVAKLIASSATLTGVDRQVDVLYQRSARVFPQVGPSVSSSFWSEDTSETARRFVAVAPRGVTPEFVTDRVVTILQQRIRELVEEPGRVCEEAGVDVEWAEPLIDRYGVDVIYGTTVRDVEAARRSLETQIPFRLHSQALTGATPFEEVRIALDRLEHPEFAFEDRLHVVAASNMLSHGVDIDRLNVMVMVGLPLTTAEFIQTTARVGRRWPGLVYVIHRIAREREMANFLQFTSFVRHGDRFVEPIAVTRRSRRVLSVTTPGLVEARRLGIHEPAAGVALSTVRKLRDYFAQVGVTESSESSALIGALGFDGPLEEGLRDDIESWLHAYFTALNDPATTVTFPNELSPSGSVMRSLRDVEDRAPIHGES